MLIYPRCLCNVAAVLTTAVMAGMLSACIGDLSQAEFPCLVEQDLYNKYNESYVFSPQGEKKRQAMEFVKEAEAACLKGELPQ